MPQNYGYVDSLFITAAFASIVPWLALIRTMQEQLSVDAGVELTRKYSQRVAEINSESMLTLDSR